MSPAEAAFLLVALHLAVDFPLQGDTTAVQKSRRTDNALSKAVPWPYWMAAHAASHGVAVWIVTRSLVLGAAETALHFLIDVGKCERLYGIHADQALHIACKIAYVALIAGGCVQTGN